MTLRDKDLMPSSAAVEIPAEYHHCCALLFDTSSSMDGAPILNLNTALKSFKVKLEEKLDELKYASDVCVITFGKDGVTLVQDFVPLPKLENHVLTADGVTPMIEAVRLAMDKVEQRKNMYKQGNTPYHRPWIFIFTDGAPTDEKGNLLDTDNDVNWLSLVRDFQEAYDGKHLSGYGVAVGSNANVNALAQLVGKGRVFGIDECSFEAMFAFLVESMAVATISKGNSMPSIALPSGVVMIDMD